ncbi:MAG: hypothetical protein BGO09_16320 [Bacteroidetes bacterium 47-18]|nr:MAG: hypothetical protein BGO09_16320 [Bacteroidetes bacterium 47-18]
MDQERKDQIRASFERSKTMALYGARLLSVQQGYIEIEVDKQDFMARPAGMFNGAAIATLVDVASGYAAVSAKLKDSYVTTVELKINYLSPAIGEQLRAKAQVIKNGKVLSVVRVDVYAVTKGMENLAATSLVTMMQLRNPSAP